MHIRIVKWDIIAAKLFTEAKSLNGMKSLFPNFTHPRPPLLAACADRAKFSFYLRCRSG